MSWISVEDKKPVGSFWYLISSNGNVTMAQKIAEIANVFEKALRSI